MTQPPAPAPTTKPSLISAQNLSWIAMVAMAGMCLAALVWAASLNLG